MLNTQEDKTHWGRFSSSKRKHNYNGTTFTHMRGDMVSVKNRLYPNKIAPGFCDEASRSGCGEGCKERCLRKGPGEVGEWGRESHGKRCRDFMGFFAMGHEKGLKLEFKSA